MTRKGRLFLMPSPLDLGCSAEMPLQLALPNEVLRIAANLSYWVCENAKTTRAFLNRVNNLHALQTPLQAQVLQVLPRQAHKAGDHLIDLPVDALLQPALDGHDMGLVSEAGLPAVADPGSSVVRAAHRLGISVMPLVGPSALLLALSASGLNGQDFAFVGYLPIEPAARRQSLEQLEQTARQRGQTQLFIETPHRNAALLATLTQTLNPNTVLSLVSDLGLPTQHIQSRRVADWKSQPWPAPGKNQPTVFLMGVWPG